MRHNWVLGNFLINNFYSILQEPIEATDDCPGRTFLFEVFYNTFFYLDIIINISFSLIVFISFHICVCSIILFLCLQVTEENCRLVPDEPLRSAASVRESFDVFETDFEDLVEEQTRRWVDDVDSRLEPDQDAEGEETALPQPAVPDRLQAMFGVEEVEMIPDDELPPVQPPPASPQRRGGGRPRRPESVRSGGPGRPRIVRVPPPPPVPCDHPVWLPAFDPGELRPHTLGRFNVR